MNWAMEDSTLPSIIHYPNPNPPEAQKAEEKEARRVGMLEAARAEPR